MPLCCLHSLQAWSLRLPTLAPHLKGPVYFLWGTDWEDAPIQNAKKLHQMLPDHMAYDYKAALRHNSKGTGSLHAFFKPSKAATNTAMEAKDCLQSSAVFFNALGDKPPELFAANRAASAGDAVPGASCSVPVLETSGDCIIANNVTASTAPQSRVAAVPGSLPQVATAQASSSCSPSALMRHEVAVGHCGSSNLASFQKPKHHDMDSRGPGPPKKKKQKSTASRPLTFFFSKQ